MTHFIIKIYKDSEINLSLIPIFLNVRETAESELLVANSSTAEDDKSEPSISLAKKQFPGKYAICADEFSDEMVITYT